MTQVCKYSKQIDDFTLCKPKHSKPKKILLECGQGTGSRTFTIANDDPFQLANVTVDTTCLCKPEVLIKFSSLVEVELISREDTIRLQYELFGSCNGQEEPISLGNWMFEKRASMTSPLTIEESFDFIYCESSNCQDCCMYFVVVTPIVITGDEATATVSNGRIAALVQGLYDSSSKEYKENVKKHKKCMNFQPNKLIFSCGQGAAVSQSIDGFTDVLPTVTIADVTIDTSCLNKPQVLIEFSSIIGFSNNNFNNIILQFELFKVCCDREPISCGVWTFQEFLPSFIFSNFQDERAFSFIFCDCSRVSQCCKYFVKATPLQVDTPGTSTWAIYNNRINAYAQSSKKDCLNFNNKMENGYVLYESIHPKPKEILLECGTGTGSKTFTSNDDPFQLANVTIDTTTLCKPVVNIEFSSIVNFKILFPTSNIQLQYELFSSFDGGVPIPLSVWTLNRSDQQFDSTESVAFSYCHCITCPGCYDYFVTVKPIQITGTPISPGATVTVDNGRIAALAQEG